MDFLYEIVQLDFTIGQTCIENMCTYCIERGVLIAQIDKENEWNENARMIFKELYEEVPGVKEYVQSHGYGYMIW